jgi:large subunit ribosomal protein L1
MKHRSWKKYAASLAKVDRLHKYPLSEAIDLAKDVSYSSFVGALEVHIATNANPKYNDQMMRWTVVLPHGTGKTVTVGAFVSDDQLEDAKKAGADVVGNSELIKAIEQWTITFDVLITTADMMRDLAKVAKILGPKWLMPSPKAWTVTQNIAQTIDEIKKGRVEFKLDKTGNIHVGVGKLWFTTQQLLDNCIALFKAVVENKPSWVKGKLVKKVVLAPTMWPWIPTQFDHE